jgi:hypothetical protein
LVDDGQALPAVPRAGATLQEIRLQLIQDQHDPDHGLWNRLIIREHPLKGAPLVGAQLRYLILRRRCGAKSAKDVWVYELAAEARRYLRRGVNPPVVPRSIFCGLGTDSWTQAELDGLELGDRRLERRFEIMLSARWKHPERSFFRSFGSAAAGKAAYRLVESSQADKEKLPQQGRFAHRLQHEDVAAYGGFDDAVTQVSLPARQVPAQRKRARITSGLHETIHRLTVIEPEPSPPGVDPSALGHAQGPARAGGV